MWRRWVSPLIDVRRSSTPIRGPTRRSGKVLPFEEFSPEERTEELDGAYRHWWEHKRHEGEWVCFEVVVVCAREVDRWRWFNDMVSSFTVSNYFSMCPTSSFCLAIVLAYSLIKSINYWFASTGSWTTLPLLILCFGGWVDKWLSRDDSTLMVCEHHHLPNPHSNER